MFANPVFEANFGQALLTRLDPEPLTDFPQEPITRANCAGACVEDVSEWMHIPAMLSPAMLSPATGSTTITVPLCASHAISTTRTGLDGTPAWG